MPLEYEVDRSSRLISVTVTDDFAPTLSEFKETVLEALTEIRPEHGFDFLVDGDLFTGAATSSTHVEAVLSFLNSIEPCKLALVTRSPVAFGMARMAEALSQRTMIRVRAFTDHSQARIWLAQKDEDSGNNPRSGPTVHTQ
jgi:hypothetical protein